ncbi:ABC transporter C family member 5-like [Carica papaya]|uniref:ABC transporter C family member 5-like n=1 Tax=Carica papaya TaxID=3649 RepID=UPI000B8CBA79|nr:ABC transporter C family member 5-like [Carica papaya]
MRLNRENKRTYIRRLQLQIRAAITWILVQMFKRRGEGSNNGDEENIEDPLLVEAEAEEEEDFDDDDEGFSRAGNWSRITFRWLNPIFKKSQFQKITLSDIPSLSIPETAESSSSLLQKSLNHSSLQKSLIYSAWKPLAINGVFAGVNTIASYMGPFLISYFVSFLTQKRNQESYRNGLILAFIFFLSKTIESLTQRQWYFGAQRIGIQVKAALTVFLYKKTLCGEGISADNGKITNLINVDVDRVGDFFYNLHNIWLLPVQVMLALSILCYNLGPGPSFVSLFATFFVMTANIPLAKLQSCLHSNIMDAKDSRIKATSECLKNMRVLKLHSWEPAFLEKLLLLRGIERSWVNRYLFTSAAIQFLFWTSPTLVSAITFGTCIWLNTPLTSGMVLSAIATFASLREPIYNLPELVSTIAQTRVSINRIEKFVGKEDKREYEPCVHSSSEAIAVKIEPGEHAWSSTNDEDELARPKLKITGRF